ncbi:MAG: DUF4411 family protein [Campylobacter sp.]|nr:DUF4411 family protein [Campylobacter sp.]
MSYLIDTNILIEAKNRYYPFEIVPGFWKFIKTSIQNGTIFMTKMVYDELRQGDDDLSRWVQQEILRDNLFDDGEQNIQQQYALMANDINERIISKNFKQNYIDEFLAKADLWLIAAAKINNFTVVTNEDFIRDLQPYKVKIPNICAYYEVACITPFEMLQNLNMRLILQ